MTSPVPHHVYRGSTERCCSSTCSGTCSSTRSCTRSCTCSCTRSGTSKRSAQTVTQKRPREDKDKEDEVPSPQEESTTAPSPSMRGSAREETESHESLAAQPKGMVAKLGTVYSASRRSHISHEPALAEASRAHEDHEAGGARFRSSNLKRGGGRKPWPARSIVQEDEKKNGAQGSCGKA